MCIPFSYSVARPLVCVTTISRLQTALLWAASPPRAAMTSLSPGDAPDDDDPLRPATRSALDCPTCFIRCSTRGGLVLHRMSHLRDSNQAGGRGRGRAAGRPPPATPREAAVAPTAAPGDSTTGGRGGEMSSQAALDLAGAACLPPTGSTASVSDPVDAGSGASLSPPAAAQVNANVAEQRAAGGASAAGNRSGIDPVSGHGGGGDAGSLPAQTEGVGVIIAGAPGAGVDASPASAAGWGSGGGAAASIEDVQVSAAAGAAERSALDPKKDLNAEVRRHILSLMAISRRPVLREDTGRSVKRRRLATGEASVEPEYVYTTVATAVQALYEDEGD